MRYRPDILNILDLPHWEPLQKRWFPIPVTVHVFSCQGRPTDPLITPKPWPHGWNKMIASSRPSSRTSQWRRILMNSLLRVTSAHDYISFAFPCRDVVTMWLDCPEARTPIKMTYQPCRASCSFSTARRRPRRYTVGAESEVNWNGCHIASRRESFL